jgi:hypothetical protein
MGLLQYTNLSKKNNNSDKGNVMTRLLTIGFCKRQELKYDDSFIKFELINRKNTHPRSPRESMRREKKVLKRLR